MSPVFNYTITDKYGDEWQNAICRVADFTPVKLLPEYFKAQEDDTFEKQEVASIQDESMPHSLLYSIEFWSKIALKQQGKDSRGFKNNGETYFEVDMKDAESMHVFEQSPGTYEEKCVAVCVWHFKHKA